MQVSRSPDGLPRQVPVPVNDYGTGLLGAFGTLLGLYAARQTGLGRRVLGSLSRTATFLQLPELFWDARGDSGPGPVHLPGLVDFVRCTDGWVAALRPEGAAGPIAPPPAQDCASAVAALRAAGVRCLRAATLADLRSDPRLRDHGYLKVWQHPVWGEMTNVFAHGVSSGFRQRDGWPAPDPGADGEEILAGLGYGRTRSPSCAAAARSVLPRRCSRGPRRRAARGERPGEPAGGGPVSQGDGGGFFTLRRGDQVATITVADAETREEPRRRGGSVHWEFAALLNRLRTDNSVRVIVITGARDGEFWAPPPRKVEGAAHSVKHRTDPAALWRTFNGIIQLHQSLIEIEKPVVARVNGDAVGTGSSVLFGSDLSVAVKTRSWPTIISAWASSPATAPASAWSPVTAAPR